MDNVIVGSSPVLRRDATAELEEEEEEEEESETLGARWTRWNWRSSCEIPARHTCVNDTSSDGGSLKAPRPPPPPRAPLSLLSASIRHTSHAASAAAADAPSGSTAGATDR